MANLKRNNLVAIDLPYSKFLYMMLKQMPVKSIDWDEVADNCEITNGHAARMRFSRFKAQMEGTDKLPARRGRPPANHEENPAPKNKKRKASPPPTKPAKRAKTVDLKGGKGGYGVKSEGKAGMGGGYGPSPKAEPGYVKIERENIKLVGPQPLKAEGESLDAGFNPFLLYGMYDSGPSMDALFEEEMAPYFHEADIPDFGDEEIL